MTRHVASVVAILTVTCCSLASGCNDSDFSIDPSAQWVTIRGNGISIRMPPDFRGGNPADATAVKALTSVVDSLSDPEAHTYYAQVTERLRDGTAVAESGFDLLAWANLDGKALAGACVTTESLDNLLFPSDGDSSIQAVVDAYMLGRSKAEWTLEDSGVDWATVTLVPQEAIDDPYFYPQFIMLRVTEDECRAVVYSCPEEYWPALYDVFKESSGSIATGDESGA